MQSGLDVNWAMLFLAGSVSCSRAGFLCPAVHLLGEIRARWSAADKITPHFQLPPFALDLVAPRSWLLDLSGCLVSSQRA